MAASSSSSEILPESWQVFINFRGEELRNSFISHLEGALTLAGVKYYIDTKEVPSEDLTVLFKRIEQSEIALCIFSSKYAESKWCLDELVKIMEQVKKAKLRIIPVFFNVTPEEVKEQKGEFGLKLYAEGKRKRPNIPDWENALQSVPSKIGLNLANLSNERELVDKIVDSIKRVLALIPMANRVTEYLNGISKDSGAENVETFSLSSYEFPYSSLEISVTDDDDGMTPLKRQDMIDELCRVGGEHLNEISTLSSTGNTSSGHVEPSSLHYGIEPRLKELEEKLQFDCVETKIVGIVGMPGIGKTTLSETLYRKWEHKFKRSMFFPDVSKITSQQGLQERLLEELLKDIHYKTGYTENQHEFCKNDLLEKKVFLVIDDVSSKRQLKSLFGQCDWIKKGSKIVITSSDESVLKELVEDTYVVPRLNSKGSLLWFNNHAFGLDHAEGNFVKLSRHFLNYAKGNPLALRAFGVELRGKDEAYWEQRIGTLAQSSNNMIQYVLRKRYDELITRQQEAFLDVACFFKSENVRYVRCMVNSCDSESTMVWDDIRDLQDKFLVNISCGRVEMHDIVCTFAKELASQALTEESTWSQHLLWNYQDIICLLKKKLEMKNVRGIFLDMSEVPEEMIFDSNIFSNMCNLRYLKIYNSACPTEGEGISTFDILKEIQLPLDKVRYLHWMKYPWEKLPSDFNPKNLVDLELPYSSIEKVWEGIKDTPKLKWANLCYSSKLTNLLGLSNAKNLERLNLEGCKSLLELPQEMENMESLVFLNMRRCTSLTFLQSMKLSSLKILILSDCSKLQEFEVISKNLEALYLDGTAIKGLPPATSDLMRLAILNMKGCIELESLPERLGNQKALEELILSGCSKLESVPKDVENMKHLRILLLDGTRIREIPKIYSMQRLCLSRNNAMVHLQGSLSQFYHLKWLVLKNCENLRHLPTLPPNLEYLNAYGCERLETVGNPLFLRIMTEPIRSTFFFTNCKNLNQDAKESISSYAEWKCHQLAVECYDKGIVSGALFNTCYTGFELPSWFHDQAVGSVLEPRLKPLWCNNRLSGIALSAVVSFHENQDSIMDTFSLKCTLQFENEDGSRICFECDVGSLNEPGKIEADHVFISYVSCSHITKRLEDHYSGNSIPTKASLEFYLTDAGKSEVVDCGLCLMYAEPDKVSVEENGHETPLLANGHLTSVEANGHETSLAKGPGFIHIDYSSIIILSVCTVIICFAFKL